MMRWAFLILAAFTTAACKGDETASAYGAADKSWQLSSINGAPFEAVATMAFGADGAISGQAPCNRFNGQIEAPYPWFNLENIAVTRMACPELQSESQFFEALQSMTLIEVSGDHMVLSNDTGAEMAFTAQPDD